MLHVVVVDLVVFLAWNVLTAVDHVVVVDLVVDHVVVVDLVVFLDVLYVVDVD